MRRLALFGVASQFALLGAVVAPTAAQAAPVEYVKVCSLYGAGFYYIPGTDQCADSNHLGFRVVTEWGVLRNSAGATFGKGGFTGESTGNSAFGIGAWAGGDPNGDLIMTEPTEIDRSDPSYTYQNYIDRQVYAYLGGVYPRTDTDIPLAPPGDPSDPDYDADYAQYYSDNGGMYHVFGASSVRYPRSNFANTNNTSIGQGAQAGAGALGQDNATAVGQGALANALNATAIGQGAQANAENSVALGRGSIADVANTVSVGQVGSERKIVNVAAGTVGADSTEVVVGSQLFEANSNVAAALGGGASVSSSGVWTAPSYSVQGSTHDNVGSALTALDSQVTTNTDDISDLQTDVAANTSDITDLQTDVTSHASAISDLETDVADNSDDIADLQTSVTANTDSITDLQTDVAANTSDISDLQTDVAANTSDIGDLQTSVAANTSDIGDLQTSVADNTSDISNLQTDVAANTSAITGLQTDVADLQSGVSGLQTDVSGLQADVSGLQTDVAGLQTDVASNTSAITGLQSDVSGLQSDVADVQTDIAANTSAITGLETDVADVQTDVAGLQTDVADVQTDVAGLQTDLADQGDAIDGLETTVAGQGTAIAGLQQGQTTANGRIDAVEDGIETGSIGLVRKDADDGHITVDSDGDGATVDFAGADGDRRLTGVAAGVMGTDVVNVAQLEEAIAGVVAENGYQFGDTPEGVEGPEADGEGAYAAGYGSTAAGDDTTAIGTGAEASFEGATAIGAGAKATADPTTAVGFFAEATGNNASAFGGFAQASAENSTAIGESSVASGVGSTALGRGAVASAANSVALGAGSTATRGAQSSYAALGLADPQTSAGEVSVGTSSGARQITNVAAGSAPTDAVNVGQLAGVREEALAYTNLAAAVFNQNLDRVTQRAEAGTAAALATAGLVQATEPGKSMITAGVGTWRGQSAVAFGLSHRFENAWTLKAAGAYATEGGLGANAAVGFEF